jgi:ribosomal protein L13E
MLLQEAAAVAYDSIMKIQINKPITKRRIRGVKFTRSGRGFSKSELKEVGIINMNMAKNKCIPLDLLRKTIHQENIEELKLIGKDILNLGKKAEKKR